MGYTHYFTLHAPKRGETKATQEKYLQALKDCTRIVKAWQEQAIDEQRLSGYTAHCEPGEYGGLKVNGKGENAHEDFCLPERLPKLGNSHADFCKTARKPYDVVVTACLIVLKLHLGDRVDIQSDGTQTDWIAGLNLACIVLNKNVELPTGIRKERVSA